MTPLATLADRIPDGWKLPLAAVAMGALGFAMTLSLHRSLPPGLEAGPTLDLYFDADITWYVGYFAEAPPHTFQSIEHPFLRWMIHPVARLFMEAFGASPWTASGWVMAANAFVWTALLYLVLFRFSGRHGTAAALTLLGLSSAAAVFWLPAAESFPFGSTAVLLAFALPAFRRRPVALAAFFAMQVLTLAFVITHWAAGMLTTALALNRRAAIGVTLAAMAVLAVAFLFDNPREVPRFGGSLDAGEVTQKYRSFPNTASLRVKFIDFFLTPLSPVKAVYTEPNGEHWEYRQDQILSTRRWGPGRYKTIDPPSGSIQLLGYVVWSALLLAGAVHAARTFREQPLVAVAVLFLVFQFLLHINFGEIMFLYCLGWMPVFLMLIAHLSRARRRWVVAAALLIIVVNARTNFAMLDECNEVMAESIAGEVEGLKFAGETKERE